MLIQDVGVFMMGENVLISLIGGNRSPASQAGLKNHYVAENDLEFLNPPPLLLSAGITVMQGHPWFTWHESSNPGSHVCLMRARRAQIQP